MNTLQNNIMIGALITLLPIIIINYKEIKSTKKQTILWGILSFMLSFLILKIIGDKIEYIPLISTVLSSSILNYFISKKDINLKKLPKTLLTIFLFFFIVLVQLIPIAIFNLDINKLTALEEILLTIFSNIVLIIILSIMYFKTLKEDFNNIKKNLYKNLDIGIKYWFIGLILMVISNIIIGIFIPQANASNETAVQDIIKNAPAYLSIISIGIITPIIEELVFRKAFKDVFKNKYLFIFMSGFIFGALHVILSFTSAWDLLYLLPYCSLGFAFATMYYKTDNIYTSITLHIFHNTVLTTVSAIGAMMIL